MTINQKILQIARSLEGKYFTAKQLRGILQINSTLERQILAQALRDLQQSNDLIFDERNHRYRIVNENDFGKAVFQCNARGFGFLVQEDGDDLFVPASKTHGAFHNDTVLFQRVDGTKDEAEIVKVVERGSTQIVGTYDKRNNTRFVIPDDKRFTRDIHIQPKRDLNAKNGQKVVVRITVFPTDNRSKPEGEIIQILGFKDDKNVDMLSVAAAYGLSQDFNADCTAKADKIPQQLQPSDYEGRRDLRNETIFTIDGEDAKDLDDAVSVRQNDDGTYNLKVHIADVSHYV
ncbi:MAG: RNB domain-containing ribonuclease, partial [Clostridia bacterium]|nr:RNB domain-containing ribonuclease [Clostridia bacterium]